MKSFFCSSVSANRGAPSGAAPAGAGETEPRWANSGCCGERRCGLPLRFARRSLADFVAERRWETSTQSWRNSLKPGGPPPSLPRDSCTHARASTRQADGGAEAGCAGPYHAAEGQPAVGGAGNAPELVDERRLLDRGPLPQKFLELGLIEVAAPLVPRHHLVREEPPELLPVVLELEDVVQPREPCRALEARDATAQLLAFALVYGLGYGGVLTLVGSQV